MNIKDYINNYLDSKNIRNTYLFNSYYFDKDSIFYSDFKINCTEINFFDLKHVYKNNNIPKILNFFKETKNYYVTYNTIKDLLSYTEYNILMELINIKDYSSTKYVYSSTLINKEKYKKRNKTYIKKKQKRTNYYNKETVRNKIFFFFGKLSHSIDFNTIRKKVFKFRNFDLINALSDYLFQTKRLKFINYLSFSSFIFKVFKIIKMPSIIIKTKSEEIIDFFYFKNMKQQKKLLWFFNTNDKADIKFYFYGLNI